MLSLQSSLLHSRFRLSFRYLLLPLMRHIAWNLVIPLTLTQIRRSSATALNHDHSISFIGDCTLVAMAPAEATEAEADADAEAEIEADADAKD